MQDMVELGGGVAQVVEQRIHKPRVGGSSPSSATTISFAAGSAPQPQRWDCQVRSEHKHR